MNTSILGDLSDQLRELVNRARGSVVCVGTGKAAPRAGLLIGNGEVLTVARAADQLLIAEYDDQSDTAYENALKELGLTLTVLTDAVPNWREHQFENRQTAEETN